MRNATFDVVKFFLMLGVIAGHLVPNGIVQHGVPSSYFLSNVIVGVSMPLFFMISGYFSAKMFFEGDIPKIMARILSFLWPLFTLGCVFGCVLFLIGDKTLLGVLRYPFVRVIYGGWFLRTLAIIYFLVALIWRFRKWMWRWGFLVLVYIAIILLPRNGVLFCWTRDVMHMLPYFIFGLTVLKNYEPWRRDVLSVSAGLVFLLICMLEGDVSTNGMGFYWTSSSPRDMFLSGHGLVCFIGRPFVGISGGVFLLWFVDHAIHLFPSAGALGKFGLTTLGVYVIHEWPLVTLGVHHALGGGFPNWAKWPLTMLIFFSCHFLVLAIRKVPVLNFCLFGDVKLMTRLFRW